MRDLVLLNPVQIEGGPVLGRLIDINTIESIHAHRYDAERSLVHSVVRTKSGDQFEVHFNEKGFAAVCDRWSGLVTADDDKGGVG